MFSDDTSVIVGNPSITDLECNLNWVFKKMNRWFNRNLLSLNFSTTCFTQFHSKNTFTIAIYINYDNKTISNNTDLKFLGLQIDSTTSWKSHIEMITPKIESDLFYDQDNKINIITCITKNDLLCLFLFSHDIWTYFLGKFHTKYQHI